MEDNSRRGGGTGLWEENSELKEGKGNWIEVGMEIRMWTCSWKLSEESLGPYLSPFNGISMLAIDRDKISSC